MTRRHRALAFFALLIAALTACSSGADEDVVLENTSTAPEGSSEQPVSEPPKREFRAHIAGDGLTYNEPDYTTFGALSDAIAASSVVVVAEIEGDGDYLAPADEDSLLLITEQYGRIDRVLKDESTTILPDRDLRLLGVGPNLTDPDIRESANEGNLQLNLTGLGVLPPGTYLLLLQPAGRSIDPEVDFTGGYTLVGTYQGAIPIVDGFLQQFVDPPLLDSVGGFSLTSEMKQAFNDQVTRLRRSTLEGADGLTVDDVGEMAP